MSPNHSSMQAEQIAEYIILVFAEPRRAPFDTDLGIAEADRHVQRRAFAALGVVDIDHDAAVAQMPVFGDIAHVAGQVRGDADGLNRLLQLHGVSRARPRLDFRIESASIPMPLGFRRKARISRQMRCARMKSGSSLRN